MASVKMAIGNKNSIIFAPSLDAFIIAQKKLAVKGAFLVLFYCNVSLYCNVSVNNFWIVYIIQKGFFSTVFRNIGFRP